MWPWVPEGVPGLAVLPEEDLALDETAAFVDGGDGGHRPGWGREEGGLVVTVYSFLRTEKGMGTLAALDGPLDADGGGVKAEAVGDSQDHGILDVDVVLGGLVAVWAGGGADGAEARRCRAWHRGSGG